MTEHTALPEALRRAVTEDLRPVRPLPPPAVRTLQVVLCAALVLVAVTSMFGTRHDLASLGMWLGWGVAVLEMAAGLALVWLALREAVPGRGVTRGWGIVALAAAVGIQIGTAVLTWLGSSAVAPLSDQVRHGAECFSMESVVGVPALVLTLLLVARAFPVRPAWAGLLGGAGAGMLADAIQHLVCGIPDLRHVLIWHGGAAVFLALVGGAVGWLGRRTRAGIRG